ncbi:MAG: hypothetical protein PVS2B2_04350 [Candidatus Acidiferrum sp.]
MPTAAIKILLIEDNPGDVRLFKEALQEAYASKFELVHHELFGAALVYLTKENPDVVVLDLGLPDAHGIEVVQKAHAAAPKVALVVLTAVNDEALGLEALQEGAQDYLVKGHLDASLLSRALRYAMERKRVQLQVFNLSLLDDLTGLNNRRGFLALAEHHMKLAYRTGKTYLLAFIDLDGMKQINDTFGHQEGNRALVDAAEVLKDSFRQSDILARIGGDEFAALVVEAGQNSIGTVIRRMEQKLAACNAMQGRRYHLSFSIGIIPSDPTRLSDIEELLSEADSKMYLNKHIKKASRELMEAGKSVNGPSKK